MSAFEHVGAGGTQNGRVVLSLVLLIAQVIDVRWLTIFPPALTQEAV
jgi:hypothetical protein